MSRYETRERLADWLEAFGGTDFGMPVDAADAYRLYAECGLDFGLDRVELPDYADLAENDFAAALRIVRQRRSGNDPWDELYGRDE